MNQHKMYRCIKLMQLLQEKARHIHTIEKYLQVSNRTVYRYLKLYENLGYKIIKVNQKIKLENGKDSSTMV